MKLLHLICVLLLLSCGVYTVSADEEYNMTYGQTLNGSISVLGQMNTYNFTASATDVVVVRTRTNWTNGPHVRVYAPNNTLIAEHSGYALSFPYCYSNELQFSAPTTGNYTITIEDYTNDQTGTYSLSVQKLNPPANVVPITYGQTLNGSISVLGQMNTYNFTASATDVVVIRTRTNWTNGPHVRVYAPNNTLIAEHSGYALSFPYCYSNELQFSAPTTGNYTITIEDYANDQTGTYTIFCDRTNPVELFLGHGFGGNTSQDKWQYFYLTIAADENLLVKVDPGSNPGNLELYGSFNYLPDATRYDFVQKAKGTSGTYDLLISSTKSGTYWFGVYGKNVAGYVPYTIIASAGDKYVSRIYPTTVLNSTDTRIQVYGLGFSDPMQVKIKNNSTGEIPARSVIFGSPTTLINSFDLSGTPVGIYDLVVIWPDATQKEIPGIITINEKKEGVLYENSQVQVTPGIPFNSQITVSNEKTLFITLQKTSLVSYGNSWNSQLSVSYNGSVISSKSGSHDLLLELVNPEPGTYDITILSPSHSGKGILTARSSLPQLPLNDWIVGTVHTSYGSVWYQTDVPPDQNLLTFESEGVGAWSHFDIDKDVNGSPQHWISKTGYQTAIQIPHPSAGSYIVEYLDSAMLFQGSNFLENQSRDILLKAKVGSQPAEPVGYLPLISGMTPSNGGNSGTVSVTLKGAWLKPDASVRLTRSGYDPVSATSVQGSLDNSTLLATFDLVDRTPGAYSLVLTNPDGKSVTAPVPFVIEDGGKGDFWIEIVGREKIRVGTPSKYIIKYGNRGTADIPAPLVSLAANPASSNIHVVMEQSSSGGIVLVPMSLLGLIDLTHKTVATLNKPLIFLATGPGENPEVLPAGSSYTIQFTLLSNYADPFTLGATPLSGDPVLTPPLSASEIDAASPAPGIPLIFGRVYPAGHSSYAGAFGYGWVHSYGQHLEKLSNINGLSAIAIKIGNGYSTIFTEKSPSSYSAMEGNENLTSNSDGTYVLRKPDGTLLTFRSDLLLDSIRDTNGNQLTVGYNTDKDPLTISHSNGDSFTFIYNANKRISLLTDPAGRVTQYSYDSTGLYLESVSAPDGSVTRYTYDIQDNAAALLAIIAPDGITQTFQYDTNGRIRETYLNQQKEQISLIYDTDNRLTKITNQEGATSQFTVNEKSQITSDQNPVGASSHYQYDSKGNLVGVIDPKGNTYQYTYDSRDNLNSSTDPNGNRVRIGYDTRFDKLNSITDALSNTMTFGYDAKGNLVSDTYPDSSNEAFQYDSSGNIVGKTTRNGEGIQYEYNYRGQVTKKIVPPGYTATYSYDTAGNLISATDPSGTVSMVYNLNNKVTRVTYPDSYVFYYTYDDGGRLVQRSDSLGSALNYAYDSEGNLIQISDKTGSVIERYTYDPVGRLNRKVHRSGTSTSYSYDKAGQVKSQINSNTNGSVLSRFNYIYDLNSNPVQIDTLEGTCQYEYDDLDQLTKVTYPDSSYTSYSYDAAGNRISVVNNGATTSYSTNAMNQYTTAGSASFTSDRNGNLLTKTENSTTTRYEYNAENRLLRVVSPTDTWDYQYDVLGNRVGVTHNGIQTKYRVEPQGFGNVVAEYSGNGTLQKQYIHGMGLISQLDTAGNEYVYHFDPTGHVMQITNSGGAVVNQYKYAPFGEYRQKIESVSNPFTYVGEYGVMDDGNGLRYMRMRYYSPNVGRFTSEDILKTLGISRYNYPNNPIIEIDPSGLYKGEKAWFAKGPLFDIPFLFGTSVIGDLANLEIAHEQIIFDSGKNIGFGSQSQLFGLTPKQLLNYKKTSDYYDADLLREAIHQTPRGKYDLYWNNCQDWAERVRNKYEELKNIQPVSSATPEDKFGPTGYDVPDTPGNERFISADQNLFYRIDFWNKENATAPACNVYVYDDLTANVNRSTFRFNEIGFLNWTVPLEPSQYFDVNVDTRPEMNLIVNVEGVYNPETGSANITYRSLDPVTLETPEDPMAGFLPPITQSGNEVGWVSFTVDPNPGLPSGTTVQNQAHVNFDGVGPFNPAPKEGPYTNTIDSGKPLSHMTAQLINDTEIKLFFNGADDLGGSGIRDFTLYMSDNGGEYIPVLNNVNATTASIYGVPSHTYRLYSNSRDYVGNRENQKTSPDATMTIPIVAQIPVADFTANVTSGKSPLNVKFTDTSTNSPIAWNWNFGDGSSWVNGTTQTLSHTYSGVGNYSAILVVSNSVGHDQTQRIITVTSGVLPLPGFSNPPTDPDGDGLYEDLNANNRKDFNDVVVMFNQMQWIAANEPFGAFDFDFNANGRIDFNDIVKLFGEI